MRGLIERLEGVGVRVARVGEERLRERASVVLIGHIVRTDIGDTISRIDGTGVAEVVDMSLSMPGVDDVSSAYLVISAIGKRELRQALQVLEDVAREKGLLLIEPIGEEGV